MKFKPLSKGNNILELTRYNKNIKGNHISVSHGFGSQDKRNYASLCMLGIMSYTRGFDEVLRENKNAKLLEVIRKLSVDANSVVDKTFLKDDGKKVL